MKHMIVKMQTAVAATMLLSASVALAAEKNLDLSLTVGGSISAIPTWLDESGKVISEVNFLFSGVKLAPDADRDSSVHKIQMGNMQDDRTNVTLSMPSACKIGATDIAPNHVLLLVDGVPKSDGETFSFPTTLVSLQLRFAGSGGYGAETGSVTCTSGMLRYTYDDGVPTT